MADTLKAAELRELSRDELREKVKSLKEELFTLRFQAATGQLDSQGRVGAVKKDIARIYTVLRERELGIIAEPEAGVTETSTTSKKKADA
ncbi:50S ribosomal protein L29 [Granulicoccus phenolivorans]|uniref:50S ribosomal protein L29 n=1 Tax=Granulicoccus phenolivorans TaxID=266854 RepID=UPI000418850A|nr:50S ribosomal protein L29 [Granulicoccus phenolivorans]